jgi:outer membrane protein
MTTKKSKILRPLGAVAAIAAGLMLANAPARADEHVAEANFINKSPWMVRVRGIAIVPDESGDLDLNGASIPGGVDVDDAFVPELDISYFFTDNIAAELILATAPHDVKATNVGGAGGVGDVDLGEVWLLPPTLTLQYHFMPETRFKPYVGAGVNYTIFYNDDLPSGGPVQDIDYDDAFGFVLQAGVDFAINDSWSFNLDVKRVFLNTDATVRTSLGTVDADVDIDPWIFGVGVGYRF